MNIVLEKMSQKRITTSDIGALIGKSQATGWKIVNGATKRLKFEDVKKISEILDLSMDDVYTSLSKPSDFYAIKGEE